MGRYKGSKTDLQIYYRESFELTAETRYGGTVTNEKMKRVPGDGGSSYSKATRTEACTDTW